MTSYRAVHRTDVGKVRPHNEDAGFAGARLFVVCDGLGGHAAGEVASGLAVERLAGLDETAFGGAADALSALVDAIEDANRAIYGRAAEHEDEWGMGTTCTAALAVDDRLVIAHVGDSRAYLLRAGGAVEQWTVDQTPVQRLVEAGVLSREDARHHPRRAAIEQALGLEPTIDVATPEPVELAAGDRLLLCSDGLTEVLDEPDLAAACADGPPLDDLADALVAAALDGGGPDNITIVLVEHA